MNIYFGIPSDNFINKEEELIAQRLATSLSYMPGKTKLLCPEELQAIDSKSETPTLIHSIHLSKSGIQCANISKKSRTPLVITCSGMDVYIDIFHPPLRAIIQDILETAAGIVVPNNHMKTFLQSRLVLSENIHVIPPGIMPINENIIINKSDIGFYENDRIILLEGGILPAKNILFAIDKFTEIQNDYSNIKLAIVSSPLKSSYKSKVDEKIANNPNIRLIDRPSNDSLTALYRNAELMINVSHAEGYNPYLLKAMQIGLPILASDIPGNQAYIKNENKHPGRGTGLLYYSTTGSTSFERVHDGENFISNLRKLLDSPSDAKEMGKRAANSIKSFYTIEKELYLHLQLYKQILKY